MRCSTISCAASARALRALALLITVAFAPAIARADELTLAAPRAFGYVIGDTLTLDAIIRLAPDAVLDAASLPQPHKVSSWLDLVSVDIAPQPGPAGTGPYRLRMTYQSFFGALEPRTVEIPAWPLMVRHGAALRPLPVPAFRFVATPLRELVSTQGGNPLALQPDVAPAPVPLRGDVTVAALAGSMSVLGALGFALARGWRPFARRARPLAAAARQIARAPAPLTDEAYLTALMALHRAFDTLAGRRLLADDVEAFLRRRPAFAARRDDMERIFAASRIAFFGTGARAAMARLSPADLVAAAGRLARAERAAPAPVEDGA